MAIHPQSPERIGIWQCCFKRTNIVEAEKRDPGNEIVMNTVEQTEMDLMQQATKHHQMIHMYIYLVSMT